MSQTVERPEQAPHEAPAWWTAARLPGEAGAAETAGGGRPGWARLADSVLASLPVDGDWPAPVEADGDRVFRHAVLPFAAAARELLVERVPAAEGVWAGVETWLCGQLTALAARTFVVELHSAGKAGLLRGTTGRDRFVDFLRLLGGRGYLTEVLGRHPLLARLLAQTCLRTVEAVAELLTRFAADRAALRDGLLAGSAAELSELTLGAGDVHSGGRAVALLGFADGRRLVYKPRPLGLLARWGELLRWFAEERPGLAPRPLGVLARDGYGWAEYVPARPCADQAGVELFYRRQGALLALLYALDATDMHCENLVACGDQPMLVDVETLFHPAFTSLTRNGPDPAAAALHRSVARTALLPTLMLGEHGALDVSAFGGGNGEQSPGEVPHWTGAGTDDMRLAHGPRPYAGGANRPVLAGAEVDAGMYRQSLLSGFRAAYESLVDRRAELLEGALARFAGEEIRLVMRPTQVYATLLTAATHPAHLADGAARPEAFAALAEDQGKAHLPALVPHEIAELCAGDVPVFTAAADSVDVTTGTGTVLPGLLAASGLDQARAKIAQLSAEDLREQEWFVEATLATRRPEVRHSAGTPLPGAVAAVVPDSQHLLALASAIGDDLVARAAHDDGRANWVGLELLEGRHWLVLPMGAGLAEGYCGTALFLAQLGDLTGTARYSELAAKAVRTLPVLVEVLAEHPELAREVGSGGFFGLGGICYALARLASLLGDSALTACLPAAIAATAAADAAAPAGVGEGTAGALAAMHAVYAESGLPEAAALAATLSRRLAGAPRPTAPGFLWGTAGVDWALGRAGTTADSAGGGLGRAGAGLGWAGATAADSVAGDPGRAGAAAANSLTGNPGEAGATARGDWAAATTANPLTGNPGERSGQAGATAGVGQAGATAAIPLDANLGWCSGLAGQVLATAAAPGSAGLQPGTAAARRADAFSTAVAARPPSSDQSLCHGELGTLEALVVLAGQGHEPAVSALRRATSRLVGAVEGHGLQCGTPHGVASPGLLTGTGGIGFGLLRVGFAERVPSVLLLEPSGLTGK
ncbi:type 2 lantibiotic biosynthesis protein LanM [Amycolatopsis tolypomycina]|uniref:Type 2 lantibiotic biosynthesis protein LanM n=1 Tax=Amycolatopsis tolypomycina TaxID=208445 RepID=A0A1H4TNI5_9PSEU|nr:type 2 lanthipeptide synthetase LanM family protein [Amycolatopsis tolypomycina]SEC57959.1 type 2 lantibiotic biosynthesis protein LanM [Amycolatopsis tolypomycina]